jgi:hypothetical protein
MLMSDYIRRGNLPTVHTRYKPRLIKILMSLGLTLKPKVEIVPAEELTDG